MSIRPLFFAVACIAFPILATATTVPPLPTGICPLDAKVPEHAIVIDYLRSATMGSNELVAAFARCDELAAIAAKKAKSITHYGSILNQSVGQKIPLQRKDYINTVEATLKAKNNLTAVALNSAQVAAAVNAEGNGLTDPTNITADSKGILFKDDDMVILGIKQTNALGTTKQEVASTTAMTLISGESVSVNLYAPAAEANAFKQSSATLQPFVKQLIAANP